MDPFILSDLYFIQVRKTIDKAIELAPEKANLYYGRGYANFKSGYFRLAVNDFAKHLKQAIELDSLNPLYFFQRAWASYNLYDFKMAIIDLEQAFKFNSRNGDFYTLRALTVLNGDLKTEYNYCEDFRTAEKYGTTYKVENYIHRYCENSD